MTLMVAITWYYYDYLWSLFDYYYQLYETGVLPRYKPQFLNHVLKCQNHFIKTSLTIFKKWIYSILYCKSSWRESTLIWDLFWMSQSDGVACEEKLRFQPRSLRYWDSSPVAWDTDIPARSLRYSDSSRSSPVAWDTQILAWDTQIPAVPAP